MSAAAERQVFAFGEFYLDATQRLLFRANGERVALVGRAFDTLLFMVEHPVELLDKKTLMRAIWPNVIVEENNLSQNVFIVRRALGEAAGEHRFIVTVPGRGFRFVAPITRLDADPKSGPSPETPPPVAAAPRSEAAPGPQPSPLRSSRWRTRSIAAVTFVVVAAAFYIWLQHRAEQRWLAREAMPALEAFVDKDENGKAFSLADEIERRVGVGTVSETTWQDVAATVTIDSSPADAEVSYRLYDDQTGKWVPLGRTPLHHVRLPRDWLLLRYQKDGFETAFRATTSPGVYAPSAANAQSSKDDSSSSRREASFVRVFADDPARVPLVPSSEVPAGMVFVPASKSEMHYLVGLPLETPAFYVDRLETTNAEFQQFVDAGGYRDARWWKDLPLEDGGTTLDWQAAIARFTDSTGKPGPAGWELAAFMPGTANRPVTGISWFEAMAYTRFRGKSLPCLAVWVRAAMSLNECCEPIAPKMKRFGNFGTDLIDVGTSGAVGPYGTLDAGGNAAEWVLNAQGKLRLATGGSAGEAPYAFSWFPHSLSPWDRSGFRGIRAVKLASPVDARLLADIPAPVEWPMAKAMSAEAFEAIVATYDVVATAADPRVEAEKKTSYGTLRRISLRSGIANERFAAYILIPANSKPPYDSVIAMLGVEAFAARSRIDVTAWEEELVNPILRSGRAVVWPAWYGSFERFDDLPVDAPLDGAGWRDRYRNWRRDAYAVIAYLKSSSEFSGRTGFYGASFGAAFSARLLPLVPEFKAAVLVSGGNVMSTTEDAAFVRHVTTPTLFLNGRFDYMVPFYVTQRYYENIATPPASKRLVVYESGHWPLPRNQMTREIDDWLSRYLGDSRIR